MYNKKKINNMVKNFLYSFLSFMLPTIVLQFIIQPIIAQCLGIEKNGEYITIMAFNYFIIGITAGVLNNIRLLQNEKYEENEYMGDFNVIMVIYVFIITLIIPLGWYFYLKKIDIKDVFFMLIISYMYLYHDYISSEYRIKLQYNKILINNILMTIGYIVGLLLFVKLLKWQIIFLTAYTLPTIFDLFNTSYWKEPIKRTKLFRETTKKTLKLTLSSFLSTIPLYFDKFILYPIMGGEGVSIYNSASIVGKLLLLISFPLSNVLFSYIIKLKNIDINISKRKIFLIIILLGIMYFGCVIAGYPLVNRLYPKWASESKKYIPVIVLGSLFSVISNFLNTIIIKFYNLSFQIIIEIVSLILYVVVTVFLLYLKGVYGFCLGIAIIGFFKVIGMVIIILKIK